MFEHKKGDLDYLSDPAYYQGRHFQYKEEVRKEEEASERKSFKNSILETVVYCGSQKVWRVLNLNTGTIYSCEYDTKEEAVASIEDGKKRGKKTVRYVTLEWLRRD